jgi:hypothetical protein
VSPQAGATREEGGNVLKLKACLADLICLSVKQRTDCKKGLPILSSSAEVLL